MGFEAKNNTTVEQAGTYTIKDGKKPKPKKKGLHGFPKFLVIFFSILVGLPLLLVGVCYACFYDPVHTEVEVITKDPYEKEDMFQEMLVDSMDHASCEEHIVSLDLRELQINTLLNKIRTKDEGLSKFIKNLYVNTRANQLSMLVELDAFSIFKTQAELTLNYSVVDVSGEETLQFLISNIRVGRINGMQNLLDPIDGLFNLPDLSKIFEDMGFHIKVDIKGKKLTYTVKDFVADIDNIMQSTGGETNNFLQLVREILSSDKFADVKQINGPQTGSLFSFSMDLDKVQVTSLTHGADGFIVPQGTAFTQLSYTVNAIVDMLNKGYIDYYALDSDGFNTEIQLVSKYIMGGSYLVSETDNEILRLKGLGAFDGLVIPQVNYQQTEDEKIENIIKNKILSSISTLPAVVDISIDEINQSFAKNPMSAPIVPFARNKGTKDDMDFKMNYVNSDRISTLINNDTLYAIMNMNVNGYDTNLTFKCLNEATSEFGKMKFKMDKFFYGDCECSDDIKSAFMSTITDAFSDPVIKVNNGYIFIDISNVLTAAGISSSTFDVAMECVSYVDTTNPGGLKLTISAK